MQPHEERVVAEKRELDEKLGRLNTFVFSKGNAIFISLPLEEQDLLRSQSLAMEHYSEILGKRIARFSRDSQSVAS